MEPSIIMREQMPLLNALNCFDFWRGGPAVITAAIRWLNIIMFCWNWIYWSMNHSARVLPNCSKRYGWEGWRGSFSWRSLQNDCARVCMFTPAHARTPHTLQKTNSATSSSVVMWRWAGNVCRANCGFFCRPPPPRIYEQLTIWLLGPLWAPSKLLTGRFNPYSPSSESPIARWVSWGSPGSYRPAAEL